MKEKDRQIRQLKVKLKETPIHKRQILETREEGVWTDGIESGYNSQNSDLSRVTNSIRFKPNGSQISRNRFANSDRPPWGISV